MKRLVLALGGLFMMACAAAPAAQPKTNAEAYPTIAAIVRAMATANAIKTPSALDAATTVTDAPLGTAANPWTPDALLADIIRELESTGVSWADGVDAVLAVAESHNGEVLEVTGNIGGYGYRDTFYELQQQYLSLRDEKPLPTDLLAPSYERPFGVGIHSGDQVGRGIVNTTWGVSCNRLDPRFTLDDTGGTLYGGSGSIGGTIRAIDMMARSYDRVNKVSTGYRLRVLLHDNCYVPGVDPEKEFEEKRQRMIDSYKKQGLPIIPTQTPHPEATATAEARRAAEKARLEANEKRIIEEWRRVKQQWIDANPGKEVPDWLATPDWLLSR